MYFVLQSTLILPYCRKHPNSVSHAVNLTSILRHGLAHVSGHELKHLALPTGAKDQAEPDEKDEDAATKDSTRQSSLRDAKEDAKGVESWTSDS
jgi:hypothetical protein